MGSKVLLADDSITIQKVVAIIFSNEDYVLTVVDNGDAALQKAREIIPDIMLVDALMPGKNGYEVCQEVRRDPLLKNVPLLLMTGAFEPFDEDKARQCGADDFISKPFESQNLIDVINKLAQLGEERLKGEGAPVPSVSSVAEPAEPEFAAWTEPSDIGFAEETEFAESPVFEVSEPAFAPEAAPTVPEVAPQPLEVSTNDDLWGVFDMEDATDVEAVAVESQTADVAEEIGLSNPDEAFAFDEEEPSAPATIDKGAVHGAGFEPFGEQEFSFDETPIDTAAAFASADALAVEPGAPVVDTFGEIPPPQEEPVPFVEPDEMAFASESFAETAAFAPEPSEEPIAFATEAFVEPAVFDVPPAAPTVPVVEPEPAAPAVAAATAIPAAVTFDEDQLKAMLAKISREVIEKIVWEVVPDLAEVLIKEEIKKLKAGTPE